MNNMTLMPYSLYLLYAAIALLIVFCIITMVHLNRLIRCLQKEQPSLNEIKAGIAQAQVKAEAVKTKTGADAAKAKQSMPLLLLLLAIHENYKENRREGNRGLRSMNQAAVAAVEKQAAQQQLKSALRGAFARGAHF